jgi:predicted Zn-dependent protease
MDQMGVQAFGQLKASEKIESSKAYKDYISCIVSPLTEAARLQISTDLNWEVVVFDKNEANAFALPGGKIGVYTGILKVARTHSQLAAVLGHEIGHVIAHHGAERMSQQVGTQIGMAAAQELTRGTTRGTLLMGALGVGAQVGILLPFSRAQESEADLIGLDLMARAGFDPRESAELWKNMIQASGGKSPPQLLSTHPASRARIKNLEAHFAQSLPYFEKARSEGRDHSVPSACQRPQI